MEVADPLVPALAMSQSLKAIRKERKSDKNESSIWFDWPLHNAHRLVPPQVQEPFLSELASDIESGVRDSLQSLSSFPNLTTNHFSQPDVSERICKSRPTHSTKSERVVSKSLEANHLGHCFTSLYSVIIILQERSNNRQSILLIEKLAVSISG